MLFKLIYVNAAIFVGIKVLSLVFWLFSFEIGAGQWFSNWFSVPSDIFSLITQPWTLISYMFLHLDFWHIVSNMLWLYFLGQLFVQFLGEKKLLSLYILGGIAGALLYIISFNLFPVFSEIAPISRALGASASVMAIVVALGTHQPNFNIRLMFLGNVKLKYIAIFSVVLDVISISKSNSGGHIAHLGGAILGYYFAIQWKKGKDISAWLEKPIGIAEGLLKRSNKSKLKVTYKKPVSDDEFKSKKRENQIQVDQILDKISRSGYDSLSKKEKEILFKESNKN